MSGTEVRFNLQQYLEDMRKEQQAAHRELSEKVDTGFTQHAERHAGLDKRVDRIETGQRRTRWLVGTVIGVGGLLIAWLNAGG